MRYLLLIFAVFMAAPLFAPYDPMATKPAAALQPPSMEHLLGTDQLGRDVFSRALFGGQRTLAIAAVATAGTIVSAAACASLWRQSDKFSTLFLRIVIRSIITILTSTPLLITISIAIITLGNNTTGILWGLILSQSGYTTWVLVQHKTQAERQAHIEAAKSLGATEHHIFWNHTIYDLKPNLFRTALLVFNATLIASGAVTFLGFGASPGTPDWGVMLQEGRQAFRSAPWIAAAPGIGITLISMTILHIAKRIARSTGGNEGARRRLAP